ncbi:MAG TPA: AraC family transcriptional regulator [Thermoanaerobaculia bacterium]
MLKLRIGDYPAGGTMAPHAHDDLSLSVVVSGGYEERIEGATAAHAPGHMLFYPAGAVHSQQFGAAGARTIIFTPPASSLDYLRDRGVPLHAPRYVAAAGIAHLAQRLFAELRTDDPFAAMAVEGLTLELVAAFVRTERAAASDAPPAWLRAARDAVRESSDETLSLAELAAKSGRHPVHLAREFRRYFGTSVGAYRRHLRLERAEAMLRTSAEVTEVALACGFASHSHFCRAFKAAYGLTPSQFRRL